MRRLLEAMAVLLLVAAGLNIAASLIASVAPSLLVISLLITLVLFVLGGDKYFRKK